MNNQSKTIAVLIVLLLFSVIGNVVLIKKNSIASSDIEQSKGRVQILQEQVDLKNKQIDSVNIQIKIANQKIDSTSKHVKTVIIKTNEKANTVSKLKPTEGIKFFSNKLSSPVRHN